MQVYTYGCLTSGRVKAYPHMKRKSEFALPLGLKDKRGTKKMQKLAVERFSRVWSDVSRKTIVFFCPVLLKHCMRLL